MPRADVSAFAGVHNFGGAKKSGGYYNYRVEVLVWDEAAGAVIDVKDGDRHSELLCNLRLADAKHLELLFSVPAPSSQAAVAVSRGDRVLTLVTTTDPEILDVEWGVLEPDHRPRRTALPTTDGEWSQLSLVELLEIPAMQQRLAKLTGDARIPFLASNVPLSTERLGNVVFLLAQSVAPGTVGIAYDIEADVMHVLLNDDCRRSVDVWSEDWHRYTKPISNWVTVRKLPGLPFHQHRR